MYPTQARLQFTHITTIPTNEFICLFIDNNTHYIVVYGTKVKSAHTC